MVEDVDVAHLQRHIAQKTAAQSTDHGERDGAHQSSLCSRATNTPEIDAATTANISSQNGMATMASEACAVTIIAAATGKMGSFELRV